MILHINRRGLNDFLMLSKVILRSVSSSMEGTLSGSGLDIVKYTAHIKLYQYMFRSRSAEQRVIYLVYRLTRYDSHISIFVWEPKLPGIAYPLGFFFYVACGSTNWCQVVDLVISGSTNPYLKYDEPLCCCRLGHAKADSGSWIESINLGKNLIPLPTIQVHWWPDFQAASFTVMDHSSCSYEPCCLILIFSLWIIHRCSK